jgi:hypothetical protein
VLAARFCQDLLAKVPIKTIAFHHLPPLQTTSASPFSRQAQIDAAFRISSSVLRTWDTTAWCKAAWGVISPGAHKWGKSSRLCRQPV